MNPAHLPEFTAERALDPSGGRFRTTRRAPTAGRGVYPQAARGPWGPIGLPGQDCEGACLHICMTFGGGPNCQSECRRNCWDVSYLSAVR